MNNKLNLILGITLLFFFSCVADRQKRNKKFYKSFNFITLLPTGPSFDTLFSPPYVKIDTIENQLEVVIVSPINSKVLRFEKWGKGWLRRDTLYDGHWSIYNFNLHNGYQVIEYAYRNDPYKQDDFNLIKIILTDPNYNSDEYFLGYINKIKNHPILELHIDTTQFAIRHQYRYLFKQDTICQMYHTFFQDTHIGISDTSFFLLDHKSFDFFYHSYYGYFKKI